MCLLTVEQDSVGVKSFAVRSVYRNELRRKVQHLPEFRFLSPDPFFGSLALGDVDHGPHYFTQVAASVEDRMACGPDGPDSRDGVNETQIQFEMRLVADGSVELLPDRSSFLRKDPLKKCFE